MGLTRNSAAEISCRVFWLQTSLCNAGGNDTVCVQLKLTDTETAAVLLLLCAVQTEVRAGKDLLVHPVPLAAVQDGSWQDVF